MTDPHGKRGPSEHQDDVDGSTLGRGFQKVEQQEAVPTIEVEKQLEFEECLDAWVNLLDDEQVKFDF